MPKLGNVEFDESRRSDKSWGVGRGSPGIYHTGYEPVRVQTDEQFHCCGHPFCLRTKGYVDTFKALFFF